MSTTCNICATAPPVVTLERGPELLSEDQNESVYYFLTYCTFRFKIKVKNIINTYIKIKFKKITFSPFLEGSRSAGRAQSMNPKVSGLIPSTLWLHVLVSLIKTPQSRIIKSSFPLSSTFGVMSAETTLHVHQGGNP